MTSPANRVGRDAEPGEPGRVGDAPPRAVPKNAQNCVDVSIAPAQRCVNRRPSSCGNVVKKCEASLAEASPGDPRSPARTLPAVVVHRVVAAEQDPVVAR